MLATRYIPRTVSFAKMLGGSIRPNLLQPQSRTEWQKVKAQHGTSYPRPKHGVSIAVCIPQHDTNVLKVRWIGGGEDVYPYIWLRDNCQCPSCFHPKALARRVKLQDLSLSVSCTGIKLVGCGEKIQVRWSDGHQGIYSSQWLYERAFSDSRQKLQDLQKRLAKKNWGSELQDDLPKANFPDLLRNDAALLSFLENLEITGVVLISDVPHETGQINCLTKRIGKMKITHYGTTFSVHDKLNVNNLAYTSDSLDLHTDLPYLEDKPGIQLLHCIKQCSQGGDTLLADGFTAALKLKATNPEHFQSLTQTIVDFVDVGIEVDAKFNACWGSPIIQLDVNGTIQSINWSQMVRDSHFNVSLEVAMAWYAASLAFRDLLYDTDNLVSLKLQPGNMIVFDNLRVLHGRRGFESEESERLLEGGYWEWDSVRSLRRVLSTELGAY